MEVILEAEKIPHMSIVTKPTGNSKFVFHKPLKLYMYGAHDEAPKSSLNPTIDMMALVSIDGKSISQVAPGTKLKLSGTISEMIALLVGIESECDSEWDADK